MTLNIHTLVCGLLPWLQVADQGEPRRMSRPADAAGEGEEMQHTCFRQAETVVLNTGSDLAVTVMSKSYPPLDMTLVLNTCSGQPEPVEHTDFGRADLAVVGSEYPIPKISALAAKLFDTSTWQCSADRLSQLK